MVIKPKSLQNQKTGESRFAQGALAVFLAYLVFLLVPVLTGYVTLLGVMR